MNNSALTRIENDIMQLSFAEQIWLLERLAHSIREQALKKDNNSDSLLEQMADDPEIQREMRAINDEFRIADADGLND
jgi:hypothetical protein